jgi:hypothetical protein
VAFLSLALAVAALVAGALPHPGMFVAIGLAIGGCGTGWVAWRRRGARGAMRLAGAVGMGVAAMALTLGVARYAITLFAVARIAGLVSG